jgi:hypothetical protein
MNNLYRESWKSDSPQNTTCSYLTGTTKRNQSEWRQKQYVNARYLERRSFVRRMMNLETISPSSFNFFSLTAFTSSVASASRPRIMRFSKFFRKSFFEPKKLGLAKLSSEKYSDRSFLDESFPCKQVNAHDSIVNEYLNGSAREDNAALYIKGVQCLECKRF